MLQDSHGAGRAHVFHYGIACEIPPETKHSAAFALTVNTFAEDHQKVKELSRREASLALVSRCK